MEFNVTSSAASLRAKRPNSESEQALIVISHGFRLLPSNDTTNCKIPGIELLLCFTEMCAQCQHHAPNLLRRSHTVGSYPGFGGENTRILRAPHLKDDNLFGQTPGPKAWLVPFSRYANRCPTRGKTVCYHDKAVRSSGYLAMQSEVNVFPTCPQLFSGTFFPAPPKMVFPKKGSLFSRVTEQFSLHQQWMMKVKTSHCSIPIGCVRCIAPRLGWSSQGPKRCAYSARTLHMQHAMQARAMRVQCAHGARTVCAVCVRCVRVQRAAVRAVGWLWPTLGSFGV